MCSLGGVMKHLGYPESITTNERENGGGLREMKPEMHDGWGMHDPRQEGTGDREAYLFLSARCSVSGPRGSFGDGRAMRTAVASKFRQSAGDGTLRIGEMRGSHPCAWHSAAATCGAAVALSALASLLGDWGRSPQQAGACLTLWSEVPEENWPFLLKILAMSVMGAGDVLAMSPRRLPSFSQPWLAMAFGQSPARAVFWPDFASIWRFRQLSETLARCIGVLTWRRAHAPL